MRPLLLEMQGFGPYGEKVVVDFTQFANGGLYLVTGETGSGKTFIFDGICYALYGEVSGGERKTEMLRTMGIEDDVDTYVKLRFLCHGQEYEIFRKPAYERAKKRGEGKVMDNARVEFVFGTTTLTRAEEVNAKIKEIIGLNVEQFKQIVMIAQGKFAQILQKSTKERRELLREIFNTNAYINLEYHIKDKHTALVNEYEARKREINDKLHEITASDEQYAQELQDMQQAEFVQVERVLELLQQFDKIDKELLKKHNEEIERLQKEEVQLKIALEKANTFVQQTEKLTKLEKQKTAADSAAAKAKEDAGKVSEALLFFTDCREQQANTKNALLELRNLFTLSHENQKAKVNLLNIGNDLKKAAEEALQEKKQYDNVYGAFLMAQAGIIAETLQEGIPCPVCGALEHPSPAQLSSAAPTEEAVKDAKQAFDVAEGARQRIQGKLDNAKVVKEDALKNYLAAVSDFYQEDVTGLDLATIDKRVTEDGTNTSLRLKELERQEKDKEKELGMLPNESAEQYQKRTQEKALKSGQEAAAVDGAIKNLKEELAK
ncbi:MAG: SMC family ATPase [Acidaminococcaceae bacterium]|nr:SMC family ATPase [Acidaminococcaceae bacterium]